MPNKEKGNDYAETALHCCIIRLKQFSRFALKTNCTFVLFICLETFLNSEES